MGKISLLIKSPNLPECGRLVTQKYSSSTMYALIGSFLRTLLPDRSPPSTIHMYYYLFVGSFRQKFTQLAPPSPTLSRTKIPPE
jgi:hypothetical protein